MVLCVQIAVYSRVTFVRLTSRYLLAGFYEKEKLPPSYNQWIQRLARMDPRLLALLQYARKGEYVYGQVPSAAVAKMSAGIAAQLGQPAE